ncbi:tetratricopeptide repeat protein [Micromonospora taraxaci]
MDLLGGAIFGWLVDLAGEAIVSNGRGRRQLREAVDAAIQAVLDEVPDARVRESLRAALREQFNQPSTRAINDGSNLRQWIADAVSSQVAPLADPANAIGGRSYLDHIGVSSQWLTERLTAAVIAAVYKSASTKDFNALANRLGLEELRSELHRVGEGTLVRPAPQVVSAVETAPIEESVDSHKVVSFGGDGLPGGTPDFVGRQEVLADLNERVLAHEPTGTVVAVYSVDGMAGVGKTELALRVAHLHKHRYADGCYFINLHGYTDGVQPKSPELALEELLRWVGVSARDMPVGLSGRQDRWRALMARRRALIVLDNVFDVDQVRPLLPCSAQSLVLITSRTRLRGLYGARSLRLDLPPLSDAVQLFARVADTDRALDTEMVTKVVMLVGLLPVAVRAVASQIDRDYTEVELADDLIGVKASGGLIGRSSGPLRLEVHAALNTSLRRLEASERRAFRLLGLHPGPVIGVPQFAALAGLSVSEARVRLRMLASRNLISVVDGVVGHRRYELHDLVREFARSQTRLYLNAVRRAEALGRLTEWYSNALRLVKRIHVIGIDQRPSGVVEGLALDQRQQAVDWLTLEEENLLSIAESMADYENAKFFLNAATLLNYLDRYATAISLLSRVSEVYRMSSDQRGEASALLQLASVERRSGALPAAEVHYRAAANLFDRMGSREGKAGALWGIGDVARFTDNHSVAFVHLDAALELYVETKSDDGEAGALWSLGELASSTGDLGSARTYLQRALTIYRRTGDRSGQTATLRGLGDVARHSGNYPEALQLLQQALQLVTEAGHAAYEADVRRALGELELDRGELGRADEHLTAALALNEKIGNRAAKSRVKWAMGKLAHASGDMKNAYVYLTAALSGSRETGDRNLEISIRETLRAIHDNGQRV